MKIRIGLLLSVGIFACGCQSDNYNAANLTASAVYTAYDDVKQALKPHVYAPPGTRLDDFERAIRQREDVNWLGLNLREDKDGVWRYNYEGKATVYRGRFLMESNPPPRHGFAFDAADIWNPTTLAATLASKNDPVSVYLMDRFSNEGRAAVAGFPGNGIGEPRLREILAIEFNEIILGPPIYDEERFACVELSKNTRALVSADFQIRVAQRKNGGTRRRLTTGTNRLLLEDAYPQELVRIESGTGHTGLHRFVAIAMSK